MSFPQSEQSTKNFFEKVPCNRKVKNPTNSDKFRRNLDIQEESDFNFVGDLSIVHTMLVYKKELFYVRNFIYKALESAMKVII